ncbi:MAG: mannonate dehydratase [Ruminococcaceae bacterium]|nr:mannonate dehydratase [Oscillospiraceae bacterium]
MTLTDYFKSERDATWDFALQSGVKHGVIRLPEDEKFNITEKSHWEAVYKKFTDFGIIPLVIEPMPNALHDHIKAGDSRRDECIAKVIKMFPLMRDFDIDTICFNWMAHIGWLRTSSNYPERGGARVTEFKMADFKPTDKKITANELWKNYEYFVKAVIPEAEKYGIKLALHPDDPPVPRLGDVERIMISRNNIRKAVYDICPSDSLGITMCQANFFIMGENLEDTIREFAKKIHLVHFRNTKGEPNNFRETFHDNGDINMAELMKIYVKYGVDVPIRVDHVPTMAGEKSTLAGYDALGRLFAIGYLKGIIEATEGSNNL